MTRNSDKAPRPIKKRLLFALRHAPYGNALAKEALDAILATSVYDQTLSVVFMDDGVFQLIKEQQADAIEAKNFINILSALPLYDINDVFVCEASLTARGISKDAISDTIQSLTADDLQNLFHQQDHILSF